MKIEQFNIQFVSLRQELLAYALSLCHDGDQAEDLVQETLLRLWDSRSQAAQHANPKALAMAMLKNLLRDEWRHQQTRHEAHVDNPATEDNSVEAADEVELIRRIVDGLPPLQRQIFRMKELEGYDQQEIIAITGCSADSLRQNLSRARKQIRKEYLRLTELHTL